MTDSVVHRVLVLTAFVCCAFVLASFTMLARDQLAAGATPRTRRTRTPERDVGACGGTRPARAGPFAKP